MKYYVIREVEENKQPEYCIMKVLEELEESFLEQHQSQIIVSGSSIMECFQKLDEQKKRGRE